MSGSSLRCLGYATLRLATPRLATLRSASRMLASELLAPCLNVLLVYHYGRHNRCDDHQQQQGHQDPLLQTKRHMRKHSSVSIPTSMTHPSFTQHEHARSPWSDSIRAGG